MRSKQQFFHSLFLIIPLAMATVLALAAVQASAQNPLPTMVREAMDSPTFNPHVTHPAPAQATRNSRPSASSRRFPAPQDSQYGNGPTDGGSPDYCFSSGGGLTIIHSFTPNEMGQYGAGSSLTIDRVGKLYGTSAGGDNALGLAFEITRPVSDWVFTPLYSFTGGNDGYFSWLLKAGPDGTLYGTAAGGIQNCGNVLDGMIYDLMRVVASKPVVGKQRIGVESRTGFDVLSHFGLQSAFLAVRNHNGANLAATLQDAHDCGLILAAGSGDAPLALADVHVAGFAADESFVSFDVAGQLLSRRHAEQRSECDDP